MRKWANLLAYLGLLVLEHKKLAKALGWTEESEEK